MNKPILFAILLTATFFFVVGCAEEPQHQIVNNELKDTFALRPFPQAQNNPVHPGAVRPTIRTQAQMNNDVAAVYRNFRNRFLGYVEVGGQKRYFVNATGTGGAGTVTISEAHGYAMMIFALMAGVEGFGDEREVFDGLNRLRRANPSVIDDRLMSWTVYDATLNLGPSNAATDGCLDMAYALILAHRQWGAQEYLNDAKRILEGLKESAMHSSQAQHRTKLGDWHGAWGTVTEAYRTTSRSSDWRPSHFRAFAAVDDATFWLAAADTVYRLLAQVSNAQTGLMPDFIIGFNPARPVSNDLVFSNPTATWPSHFEALVSGEHNWGNFAMNAARTPWFIAKDYMQHGTAAARTHLDKIISWLENSTGSNPNNIASGYTLDGRKLSADLSTDGTSYESFSPIFAAPFASGMAAAGNQSFLNRTYSAISGTGVSDREYAMAIQLLNMILITGNWWIP